MRGSAAAQPSAAAASAAELEPADREDHQPEIMSVFVNSGELALEEIVETTEEHDAEFCSGGETVDDCSGLLEVNGDEFEDSTEFKHVVLATAPVIPASIASIGSSATLGAAAPATPGSGSGRSHKGGSSSRSSSSSLQGSSGPSQQQQRSTTRRHMEEEKRMRRAIANSNERRRMQSINAGFQSLRSLLPHHEGEKLSKAAILQQTAEYIYQLEQQKTQLLSQNLQLKRLVDQHEGGDVPTKKRKGDHGVVMSLPVHVSESGDEGLGSMSPEPLSVITVPSDGHSAAATSPSSAELAELKRQLDRERAQRSLLEKEMRNLQSQITYPERIREEHIIYGHQEVIEHTNNMLGQEIDESGITGGLQVIPLVSVPTVGSTQTVETSNADSDTPPLSPQPGCEMIVASDGGPGSICDEHTETQTQSQRENKEVSVNDLLQIESRPGSPKLVSFGGVTVFASNLDGSEQVSVATEEFSPAYANSAGNAVGQFIGASPTRPFSPDEEQAAVAAAVVAGATQPGQQQQQRLPSVLEAAIKAEPKVEVERLPSPSNSLDDGVPQARLYLANTSRQNLETIVEAIRHLEGDHLFGDEPAQDVPLALTNKPAVSVAAAAAAVAAATGTVAGKRLLHAEVNNFLQFHNQTQQQQNSSTTTSSGPSSGATQQPSGSSSRTQQRPGVIVVKHS